MGESCKVEIICASSNNISTVDTLILLVLKGSLHDFFHFFKNRLDVKIYPVVTTLQSFNA